MVVLAAVAWAWATDAEWDAAQGEAPAGTNQVNDGVDQASAPSHFWFIRHLLDEPLFS